MVKAATWVISFVVHGLLVMFALSGTLTAEQSLSLEVGTGNDVFKIEQGIGIEGFMQEGTAVETVEANETPMQMSEARPQIDEVKPVEQQEEQPPDAALPKETEVIQSTEGPQQDAVPVKEEMPEEMVEQRAPQMATLEAEEQSSIEEQKSAGEKQEGGDPGIKRAYLGKLATKLQRSKVNPHSRATGTVIIRFSVAASGTLLSKEVIASSGSQILDNAALASIDKAAPFPAFPEGLKAEKIVEVIPYRFSVR